MGTASDCVRQSPPDSHRFGFLSTSQGDSNILPYASGVRFLQYACTVCAFKSFLGERLNLFHTCSFWVSIESTVEDQV